MKTNIDERCYWWDVLNDLSMMELFVDYGVCIMLKDENITTVLHELSFG